MNTFRIRNSVTFVALVVALIFGVTAARSQNPAQASKPAGSAAGNVEAGKRVFNKYGCYQCHGREGQGSLVSGPRIGPDPIPYEAFVSYVRRPTREMPPYTAKVVTDQELADIYAFVQARQQPLATIPSIMK
jgi:mono/diheme cytochrome c family protein